MKLSVINGSPRGKNSTSTILINELKNMLPKDYHCTIHAAAIKNAGNAFQEMSAADILVFVFPLYYYALPGMLTAFLEEYYAYAASLTNTAPSKVYAIINCGFPEPSHNNQAAEIMRNFALRLDLDWRFALEIGQGPIVEATKTMPLNGFLKKSIYQGLMAIATDMQSPALAAPPNLLVKARYPAFLYRWHGNQNWVQEAAKNGLSKKDLGRMPYYDNSLE